MEAVVAPVDHSMDEPPLVDSVVMVPLHNVFPADDETMGVCPFNTESGRAVDEATAPLLSIAETINE